MFNGSFNNISVISWLSVLLMEESGKTTDLSQVTVKLYHIMLYCMVKELLTWHEIPITYSSHRYHFSSFDLMVFKVCEYPLHKK